MKSTACLAILAERKTRFWIAVRLPNRKEQTVEDAVAAALSRSPSELVKTSACHCGTGFANWANIERGLDCDVCFADPYCAWQKNSDENSNGLLPRKGCFPEPVLPQ